VSDQGAVVRCDIAIDGLKRRIVGHNPLSGLTLHLHAHYFVNLHRYSASGEVTIELANRACAESRPFESIWIERSRKRGAASRTFTKFENLGALGLKALVVGIAIIDYTDVDRPQI
jgi:hypothetical protein